MRVNFFKNLFSKKESAAGAAIAQFTVGQPQSTPRRYDTLTDESYLRNVIAYRCVRLISGNVASVVWELLDGEKEVKKHPALDLLRQPNPYRGEMYFLDELVTYLCLAGNAYVEKTVLGANPEPRELFNLRPDRMRVVPAKSGGLLQYEHEVNGIVTAYPVDPFTQESNIRHLKFTHPLNDWYGLSPVEPAAYSIDQHNAASLHNTALLQNSANPGGALIYKGTLTAEQIDEAELKLKNKYANPKDAGRPLVVGGDVEWKQFGLSPKDLDFNTGKIEVAREICSAWNVPHVLVIPGQSTYRNMEEARLMLWEETIIPLLDMLSTEFFPWLLKPWNGEKSGALRFVYNLNDVSALIPRRQAHSDRIMREWSSGAITRDEAREKMGYQKAAGKRGAEYYSDGGGGADPKAGIL
jgi:HK97 family phage portal protein